MAIAKLMKRQGPESGSCIYMFLPFCDFGSVVAVCGGRGDSGGATVLLFMPDDSWSVGLVHNSLKSHFPPKKNKKTRDRRTHGQTDRRTNPLIEMRGRI